MTTFKQFMQEDIYDEIQEKVLAAVKERYAVGEHFSANTIRTTHLPGVIRKALDMLVKKGLLATETTKSKGISGGGPGSGKGFFTYKNVKKYWLT